MTTKPKRKLWEFVSDNSGKFILLVVGFWFLCGVGYGYAHINPEVPGNPVIGCLIIGLISAAVPGLMTTNLVLEWVSRSRKKQLIEHIRSVDARIALGLTLENPEEK